MTRDPAIAAEAAPAPSRQAGFVRVQQARARLYAGVREFFKSRDVLEVQTPAIHPTTVTDPHIDSVRVACNGQSRFLHTSPEYAMKGLLASLGCDIYQLCRVFRDGESGRFHHTEFTMLEWYRLHWSYRDLMEEVDALVRHLLSGSFPLQASRFIGFQEVFLQYCGLDPWSAGREDYRGACRQAGLSLPARWSLDACQALLLDHVIATRLPRDRLVFVYDFPPAQASLARINDRQRAERFELYAGGLELANGYQELVDASEQRRRFEADNRKRKALGKEVLEPDPALIAALERGLPDCAGVAVGMDRLLMLATGVDDIRRL